VLLAARVLGHVLALAAGAAAGVLGSFTFGYAQGWVPVGLVVALSLSLAVFVSAGLFLRSRGAAAVAVAGWFAMVMVMLMSRPEGDLIVPATGLGYGWLFGGTLVAGLSLAVPYAAIAVDRRAVSGPADALAEESSGEVPTGR
jgi:hypothetical protein